MHARTGTIESSPDNIDEVARTLQEEQIPTYREQQGYKGFTVLADRSSGTIIGMSFWESEEDLQASEELAEKARAAANEAGGGSAEPAIGRYEVLIDDMV